MIRFPVLQCGIRSVLLCVSVTSILNYFKYKKNNKRNLAMHFYHFFFIFFPHEYYKKLQWVLHSPEWSFPEQLKDEVVMVPRCLPCEMSRFKTNYE